MTSTVKIYSREEIEALVKDREIEPVKQGGAKRPFGNPIAKPATFTPEEPKSLTDSSVPFHRVSDGELQMRRRSAEEAQRRAKGEIPTPDTEWEDTTPLRLLRASEKGVITDAVDILSANGFKTGQKRRRIDDPIMVALKRGWIRERHYMAGIKFFETMNGAIKHPRVVATLDGVVVDGTRSEGDISEKRARAQSALKGALLALQPKYRDPFFDWMIYALYQDVSVADLGARFSKAKHIPQQMKAGKAALLEVLESLAKHYGL